MPLLLCLAPCHPAVRHLGVEHRQSGVSVCQGGHGLHPALHAGLLPELQGLGLSRRLLGEVAAMNPLLAALGADLHPPLLHALFPPYPRHFAGEVGVPRPGLAEDALLHQLCMEGLGGLESCCVGLGLGDACANELFHSKHLIGPADLVSLGIKFGERDLPGHVSSVPRDIWNAALLCQMGSCEHIWFLLPGRWRGMLLSYLCHWDFFDPLIFRFCLVCCEPRRFQDVHALHGMGSACRCQARDVVFHLPKVTPQLGPKCIQLHLSLHTIAKRQTPALGT